LINPEFVEILDQIPKMGNRHHSPILCTNISILP
jgi:hypothetical protein